MNELPPPKKNNNVIMAIVFAIAIFIFLLTVSPVFRAFVSGAVSGFLSGMGG